MPNFPLRDQGGAQARRAAPLSGPAARASLGAGRPGNQSLSSAEDDTGLGFGRPTLTHRDGASLAARISPLNVASELARMGRRMSRPARASRNTSVPALLSPRLRILTAAEARPPNPQDGSSGVSVPRW